MIQTHDSNPYILLTPIDKIGALASGLIAMRSQAANPMNA